MNRTKQITTNRRGRLLGPALAAAATLALSVGAGSASAAANVYVADGDGPDPACAAPSQANPFHTLDAALECARSGSTVHIGPGTFDGQVTVTQNVVVAGA